MSALAIPVSFPTAPPRHLSLVPKLAPSTLVPTSNRKAAVGSVPAAPQASEAVPLRLTQRGRRVVAVLILMVAGAVGALLGTLVSSQQELPTAVETVTVVSGESLWSIAAGATEPGGDVREVMAQIVALNDLDDSALVAGQNLTVPSVR
ncbi:MAG: LysM peptidoglycan-binding domain-containing protein [Beutenbergiaceae bacterium]